MKFLKIITRGGYGFNIKNGIEDIEVKVLVNEDLEGIFTRIENKKDTSEDRDILDKYTRNVLVYFGLVNFVIYFICYENHITATQSTKRLRYGKYNINIANGNKIELKLPKLNKKYTIRIIQ